ncbi:MAG: YraN family protein [Lachnospiraceae bacterium]|nr:YraN family protein [Lachnospiraceae bacterium]
MNRRKTGTRHEAQAGVFLHANHITGITYNYRTRYGEIDIIGYDGDVLVFFEVKYRSGAAAGYAAEAVDMRKQYRICRVSDYYMMEHHIGTDRQVRYDVIAIDGDKIDWIENAYDYIPRQN